MHALHSLKKDVSRIMRWFHQARPVWPVNKVAKGRFSVTAFLEEHFWTANSVSPWGDHQVGISFLPSKRQASEPHAWNCGHPQFIGICRADLGERLFLEVLGLCVGMVSLLGKNNYQS